MDFEILSSNVRGIKKKKKKEKKRKKEKERSYLTISRNIYQATQLFAFRKHTLQKGMYSCGNINGMVI